MNADNHPQTRDEPVDQRPPMPAEEILEHVVEALEDIKAVEIGRAHV